MSHRKRSCHLDYAQHTVQRLYKPHKPTSSPKSKRKRCMKRSHSPFGRAVTPHEMVKHSSHRTVPEKNVNWKDGLKAKHRRSTKHIQSRSSIEYYTANTRNSRHKPNFLERIVSAGDDDSDDVGFDDGNKTRNDMQRILTSVRREYQEQVDHVISKWKELLDRSQMECAKYRSIYHTERSRNKKIQQTVDQLRSKLKKYKNRDTENRVIIVDLQQKLAMLYDGLTEITTPSPTPRSICSRQNMLHKNVKHTVYNDSYYFSKCTNNSTKSPLKASLPPPNHRLRRKSQSCNDILSVLPPPNGNINNAHQEEAQDGHGMDMKDKMVKTRDDLKKILDTMDDNKEDHKEDHVATNKCISLCIKYKDKLFKHKNNTIKVHQTIRFSEFVHHLSDSININPNLIQIQHDTNIIDTNNEEIMNSSLAQLDIDNFDHILVYIDYNKLLQDEDGENDGDHNQEQEMKRIIKRMEHDVDKNNAKNMLLLKSSMHSLYEYIVKMEHKERLYAIITECIFEDDANLMLDLLSAKIAEIVQCQHVRLYFKWNNIVQIIYPQNTNITQQIIANLNDDNHDNKSLLMDIINEHKDNTETPPNTNYTINCMKCYHNPSQSNSSFNSIFNKQFNYNIESTLIAPLFFHHKQYDEEQLIGMIQLINKENGNNFEFTMNDKQRLVPFTDILGIALKIVYNILSNNNIFNQLHSITRVNRGVSRKIIQSDAPRKSDDELYLLRHNSISRNASPHYDNVSTTTSPVYCAPIFNADMKKAERVRNRSTQYYINHHEQNTIVVNIGNRQERLVAPPPSQRYVNSFNI